MLLAGWGKDSWLEVCEKLELDLAPVAVSFAVKRPAAIPELDGEMAFCEMLNRAQQGNSFYAVPGNHTCAGGLAVLGEPVAPVYESGEFGAGLKVFDHYRSEARVYDHISRLNPERGIHYVLFSPLSETDFQPDLLIFVAAVPKAEILLRASSYSTGSVWTSKTTPVLGCSWLYIYPYLTGTLNYLTAGFGSGMTRRKVAPAGTLLLSIPYDCFTLMLHSLQTMPWVLPSNLPDGEAFRENLFKELGLK